MDLNCQDPSDKIIFRISCASAAVSLAEVLLGLWCSRALTNFKRLELVSMAIGCVLGQQSRAVGKWNMCHMRFTSVHFRLNLCVFRDGVVSPAGFYRKLSACFWLSSMSLCFRATHEANSRASSFVAGSAAKCPAVG